MFTNVTITCGKEDWLYHAARNGELETVKKLLAERVEGDELTDKCLATALCLAVTHDMGFHDRWLLVCKALLDAGVSYAIKNTVNRLPQAENGMRLWNIAMRSRKEMGEIFLDHYIKDLLRAKPLAMETLLSFYLDNTDLVLRHLSLGEIMQKQLPEYAMNASIAPLYVLSWLISYHSFKSLIMQERQQIFSTLKVLLPKEDDTHLERITSRWLRFCVSPKVTTVKTRTALIMVLKQHGIRREDVNVQDFSKAVEKCEISNAAFFIALFRRKKQLNGQEKNSDAVLAVLTELPSTATVNDFVGRVSEEIGISFATMKLQEIASNMQEKEAFMHLLQHSDANIHAPLIDHSKNDKIPPVPAIGVFTQIAEFLEERSRKNINLPISAFDSVMQGVNAAWFLPQLIDLLLVKGQNRSEAEHKEDVRAFYRYKDTVTHQMLLPLYGEEVPSFINAVEAFTWFLAREIVEEIVRNLDQKRPPHIPSALVTDAFIVKHALDSHGLKDMPVETIEVMISAVVATGGSFLERMVQGLYGKSIATLKVEAAFLDAVTKRDITTVETFIAAGGDINAAPKGAASALARSVWHGHVEIAKHLLTQGASIHARGYFKKDQPLLEEVFIGIPTKAERLFSEYMLEQLITRTKRPQWKKDVKAYVTYYDRFSPYMNNIAEKVGIDLSKADTLLAFDAVRWFLARDIALCDKVTEEGVLKRLLEDHYGVALTEEALKGVVSALSWKVIDPQLFLEHVALHGYGMEWKAFKAHCLLTSAALQSQYKTCSQLLEEDVNPYKSGIGEAPASMTPFHSPLFFTASPTLEAHAKQEGWPYFLHYKACGILEDEVKYQCSKAQITLPKYVRVEEVADWLLISYAMRTHPDCTEERLKEAGFSVTAQEIEAVKKVHASLPQEALNFQTLFDGMVAELKGVSLEARQARNTPVKPSLHRKLVEEAMPRAEEAEKKAFRHVLKSAGIRENAAWLEKDVITQIGITNVMKKAAIPKEELNRSWSNRLEHKKNVLQPLVSLVEEILKEEQEKSRG